MPAKESRLKKAGRFAALVGQLFVDGLVESLGQGVGGVIMDSVTRDFDAHGGHNNRITNEDRDQ